MRVRRILSLILAIGMILGVVPVGEIVAWADGEESHVKEIEIIKNFKKDKTIDKIIVKIVGINLKDANVLIDITGNESELLKADSNSTNRFRQYVLTGEEIEKLGGIGTGIRVEDDINGSKAYDIGDTSMPTVKDTLPENGRIETNKEITIVGDRLGKIDDVNSNVTAYFKPSGTPLPIDKGDIVNSNIVKEVGTEVGNYDVVFNHNETIDKDTDNQVKVKREHYYLDVFLVYGKLNFPDDMTMSPNIGPKGTIVTIESKKEIPSNISVFLKKDLQGPYDSKNMAKEVGRETINGKNILRVQVPDIANGDYEVVLTNKVKEGKNPNDVIDQYKVFKDNTFLVVSPGNEPIIEEIDPERGPISGIEATIKGRRLASIFGFTPSDGVKPQININDEDIESKNSLEILYKSKNEEEPIGVYEEIKKSNKAVEVISIERKVTGVIGNSLKFKNKTKDGKNQTKINPGSNDYIVVDIQLYDPKEDENLVQDIVLDLTTIVEYRYENPEFNGEDPEDDDNRKYITEKVELKENITKKEPFTFYRLSHIPEITNISPHKIPVDDDNKTYVEDMKIAIFGKNFFIHRYNGENGSLKYKYPIIDFADIFELNKNKYDNIKIQVFDKDGKELEGTENGAPGVKILLTMPTGLPEGGIREDFINKNIETKVINPEKNDDPDSTGSSSNTFNTIFVKPENKIKIDSVTPNVINIGKNDRVETKEVIIKGKNFDRNVEVFLEGEEINYERINDEEIKFTSPERQKGIYQITVQNPDSGDLDTYDEFIYNKTITDIKITDFSPKRGTKETIVTVVGEDFKKPDPSVSNIDGLGIYELIGTRILLGDKDINEYNKVGNQIILEKYESDSNNKILKLDDGIKLSDYYNSVIMEYKEKVVNEDEEDNEDENNDGEDDEGEGNIIYYVLDNNLSTGRVELVGGNGERYTIGQKNGKLIAEKGGKIYPLDIKVDRILLGEGDDEKELIFKTPYKIDGKKIVGNRVEVINEKNRGELHFIVPDLKDLGYYDVVAINPDSKEDSKRGEEGFYYNPRPSTRPKIISIDPKQGPSVGGITVTIKGEGFFDQGEDNKTSVSFGEAKVEAKDIKVSSDGKTIEVKVPAYKGEIPTGKKSVVVTVTNPDEGSFSLKDGFSYIKSTSKPKITGIAPREGSASGDNEVTVIGTGFLFYEPYEGNPDKDADFPYTDLNKNGNWDDLMDEEVLNRLKNMPDGFKKYILPILPKVYFGSKEAEVIDFDIDGTIIVKAPKGEIGNVKVYLLNNDMGKSNEVDYNYKGLSPQITNINPSSGTKDGKDSISIYGKDFDENGVEVQFGERSNTKISNSLIGRDKENYGEISAKTTKVEVGDLIVEYDARNGTKLKIQAKIEERGKTTIYGPIETSYDNKEFFFNIHNLKDKDGNSYPGYEKVRIIHKPIKGDNLFSRIVVDRGFSPDADSINSKHISLKTPSYYDIGQTAVTVFNPDGTSASTRFEYKNPTSKLSVSNILRRQNGKEEEGYPVEEGTPNERKIIRLPYDGGIDLSIIGNDFRNPVKITLTPRKGGSVPDEIIPINIPQENIKYIPEGNSSVDKLIVEMISVDVRAVDHEWILTVQNEDSKVDNSENLEPPVYIVFYRPEDSDLEITKVTPNFGPTAGGTTVTIEGKGFAEGEEKPEIAFIRNDGGSESIAIVPESDIISVSFDKIVIKTPPFTAGMADIKIINPGDGGNTTLPNAFNYVSNPRITSVVHPENESFVIETVSIEGGEKIKILGRDFMEGARVVFNPQLKLVEDDGQAVGDIITIDDKKYILESGVPGSEIERIDGQTITVTTPPGKLGEKGVIVINPDGGGTNIYNLVYGIPEIAAPFNVRAEVVFDQFIRVNWSGVSEALEYEIHMSIDGGKFEFIDTTELTSYAVQKLKPNTKYRFLVKAMGKYGTSEPIDESKSNEVTTGKEIGPIDIQGKPAEKTEIRKNGTRADIIVGSKDFTSKGMIIDLTKGDLAAIKDISIRIPASVISDSTGKIQVLGKDYRMNFTPSVFKTSTIEANKSKSNAGVVFNIASHNDSMDLKAGESIVGGRYKLEAVIYVDKSLSKMDYINGSLNFILDQDPLIIKNRRLTNIKTVRYDDSSKTWVNINAENRLGLYTVIGSRR